MKKAIWMFLGFLTVVLLVLTSCDTTSVTEPVEGKSVIVTGTIKSLPPEVTKPVDTSREDQPQYGGRATLALATDVTGFDEITVPHYQATTLHLTNEELLQGDWTKGPAGADEANFILGGINAMNLKTGSLADTWQIPERGKMVFHIREGVYWHNKAPTSGRELTVEDVVFSIERMCTERTAYIKIAYPNLAATTVVTGDEAARTVTIECPVSEWANAVTLFPDFLSIMPKDAVEEFGNLNDWRNSIGTGPFIMTDYISAGSITFIRNDNYWETNPIGPGKGDRLPYLDGVRLFVITDTSVRMTALRTAKIDGVGGEYDDVEEFLNNPNMKSMMYTSDSSYVLAMHTDRVESIFSKKEVRQALYYATDFNKIKEDFYGGKAVILNWPVCFAKENAGAYVPMEQLPANVQDLFSYNPAKAKELLATAGFATGFSVNVICYSTQTQVDFLSLIKQMWAEVGIEVTVDAREYGVWTSRVRARNYDTNEMLYSYTSGAWQKMINFNGSSQFNPSFIDDPVVAEAAARASEYIGTDEDKLAEINADLMPYVIEQAWVLSKPTAYSYVVWWPWRKNWNGELQVGYYNYPSYLKYTWTDLALRKEIMGW